MEGGMMRRLLIAVVGLAGVVLSGAGCSRGHRIDAKLEEAILQQDWEEVARWARAEQERDPRAVVPVWLTIEAHRRLGRPELAADALGHLREQQTLGVENLVPLEEWGRALVAGHEDAAVAWELLSSALWWQERYEEADEAAQEAIEVAPNDPVSYLVAARAAHGAGRLEEAIQYYDRAIECRSDMARAYYERGTVRFDEQDRDGAIGDFDRALSLNPDYAQAYNARGKAYQAKGDNDLAIADCDRALKANPPLAEAWFNKARAYEAEGRQQKAMQAYRKFLETGADVGLDKLVAEAERELDEFDAAR
jgi:tetratricopeptide (TPR) repeat protein